MHVCRSHNGRGPHELPAHVLRYKYAIGNEKNLLALLVPFAIFYPVLRSGSHSDARRPHSPATAADFRLKGLPTGHKTPQTDPATRAPLYRCPQLPRTGITIVRAQ